MSSLSEDNVIAAGVPAAIFCSKLQFIYEIEQAPIITGHSEPVLQSAADLLIEMIAGGNHTLIGCGLVRNDRSIERATNQNLKKMSDDFGHIISQFVEFPG